ncbi:hypothetical protein [Pyramidobacter piscolens]|uniref:hypothetical protein n=1 Tax=Pyramidobacter piscolens TaxID=638849 RepID=UPI002AAF6DDA|nr:hypothetical protein [Pyramidobacter piscolens]
MTALGDGVGQGLGYLLFLAVLCGWSWSLQRRVVHPALRSAMQGTALLLFFWIALRALQFLAAFNLPMARDRWQAYRLMQTAALRGMDVVSWLIFALLPWLDLLILRVSSQPLDAPPLDRTPTLHLAVSLVLWLAAVLPFASAAAKKILVGWIALSTLRFATGLIKNAASPARARRIAAPLAILGAFALYVWLYFVKRPAWLTGSHFIFVAAAAVFIFWESCLRSGILPCNSRYEELFALGPARMWIEDERGTPVYRPRLAPPRPGAAAPPGTQRRSWPLRGGSVLWEEDVSGLLALQEKLRELTRERERGNRLLAQRNKIRGRLLELRWQNRLCAEVERRMQDKIEAARRILAAIPERPAEAERETVRRALVRLGVLICAVKRKSHLFLKSKQSNRLPLAEIVQAAMESARCAAQAGVDCAPFCAESGSVPARTGMFVYDLFEEALESCLTAAPASLLMRLRRAGGELELRLVIESAQPPDEATLLPSPLRETLRRLNGEYRLERDEGSLYATCRLPDDGKEARP